MQIRPGDALSCCLDVKQASNQPTKRPIFLFLLWFRVSFILCSFEMGVRTFDSIRFSRVSFCCFFSFFLSFYSFFCVWSSLVICRSMYWITNLFSSCVSLCFLASSVCLFPFVCLSLSVSISLPLSPCFCICLSVCLSQSLSLSLSLSRSLSPPPSLPISGSVCLSVRPSPPLSLFLLLWFSLLVVVMVVIVVVSVVVCV